MTYFFQVNNTINNTNGLCGYSKKKETTQSIEPEYIIGNECEQNKIESPNLSKLNLICQSC